MTEGILGGAMFAGMCLYVWARVHGFAAIYRAIERYGRINAVACEAYDAAKAAQTRVEYAAKEVATV